MIELLNREPMVAGGALGSVFDASKWTYRFLELANDIRAITTGISFGDQIQFFRRHAVLSSDLYPNQPLMEDVEVSLRLKKKGKLFYFFGYNRVSPRKWQKVGFSQVWNVL